jgi:hypothetical protein
VREGILTIDVVSGKKVDLCRFYSFYLVTSFLISSSKLFLLVIMDQGIVVVSISS